MSEEATSPAETAGQDFPAVIAAAQSEIQEAVERGGLRDDPFRFPLAALSTVLGTFPQLLEQIHTAAASGSQVLSPDALARIEEQAASRARKAIERNAAEAMKANRFRVFLAVAALSLGGLIVGGGIGYWRGYANGSTVGISTATGLQESLKNNPKAAADWLRLMQANDIESALGACKGDRVTTSPDGQKGCALPVWLDPAPTAPPPT
ncbi:hypothetical protein [Gluconobacter cerinus]|uniref:hypothetical protein n=1 Tax=Gluconobacter cerinus TaxID=38307 RepID=UPI001B8BA974|nr:hypothetical protein [Gluconobacter cerinus]MBS0984257.1 hypothetical protein [Gluconobacter cerinus]